MVERDEGSLGAEWEQQRTDQKEYLRLMGSEEVEEEVDQDFEKKIFEEFSELRREVEGSKVNRPTKKEALDGVIQTEQEVLNEIEAVVDSEEEYEGLFEWQLFGSTEDIRESIERLESGDAEHGIELLRVTIREALIIIDKQKNSINHFQKLQRDMKGKDRAEESIKSSEKLINDCREYVKKGILALQALFTMEQTPGQMKFEES